MTQRSFIQIEEGGIFVNEIKAYPFAVCSKIDKSNVHPLSLAELLREILNFFTKRESVSLWDVHPNDHFEYMRTNTPPSAKLIRAIIDILDPAVNLSGNLALAREQLVLDVTWNFAAYLSYIYEAEG